MLHWPPRLLAAWSHCISLYISVPSGVLVSPCDGSSGAPVPGVATVAGIPGPLVLEATTPGVVVNAAVGSLMTVPGASDDCTGLKKATPTVSSVSAASGASTPVSYDRGLAAPRARGTVTMVPAGLV